MSIFEDDWTQICDINNNDNNKWQQFERQSNCKLNYYLMQVVDDAANN